MNSSKIDLQDPSVAENEQIMDEMRILRFTSGNCITGGPRKITENDITDIAAPAVAEGARYRFYDYKFLKAVACNFQFQYTYVNSVNRWAKLNTINQYITDLKIISDTTADGLVFSAKYGNLDNVIVLKTPLDDFYNLSTFHEFFIGGLFTNQLREWIPNFVFAIGIFKCSRPIRDAFDEKKVSTYCTSHRSRQLENVLPADELALLKQTQEKIDKYIDEGLYNEAVPLMRLIESGFAGGDVDRSLDNPVNYLVLENVPGGITMSHLIRVKNLSVPTLLGFLFQLSTALEMALKRFDFCHYDLHTNNILMRYIAGPQMESRIGNKRKFVPLGYGKPDGSRYFVETEHIATIIDFGRCHVQYTNPFTNQTKHYGYHYAKRGGIYADQSRPAYDLFKLLGFMARDICIAHDPEHTTGLRQLRESPDEEGEILEMVVARRVFRHIPVEKIDFIIKTFMFFPFFKKKYSGYSAINPTVRLRVIFWIYEQLEADKFNLDDRWPEADTDPLKQDVYENFYSYLREIFPQEVGQILWTRDTLPDNAYVFSCEFQACPV